MFALKFPWCRRYRAWFYTFHMEIGAKTQRDEFGSTNSRSSMKKTEQSSEAFRALPWSNRKIKREIEDGWDATMTEFMIEELVSRQENQHQPYRRNGAEQRFIPRISVQIGFGWSKQPLRKGTEAPYNSTHVQLRDWRLVDRTCICIFCCLRHKWRTVLQTKPGARARRSWNNVNPAENAPSKWTSAESAGKNSSSNGMVLSL